MPAVRRVLAVLALGSGLLAACGGGGRPAGTAVTSTTVAAAAASSSTAPVPAVAGEPLHYSLLLLGDCFLRTQTQVGGVLKDNFARVPCAAPHDGEVFAKLAYPAGRDDPYPGDAQLRRWATDNCYRQFPGYVGQPFELSAFAIASLTPNEENFTNPSARYRGVTCYLTAGPKQRGKLVGSARNTRG